MEMYILFQHFQDYSLHTGMRLQEVFLVGLSRFSNKSHIARAVLESVAYQSNELLESMEKDIGTIFDTVNVDGGMVVNNLLMQFQSDIFDKKVIHKKLNEITALGAGAASLSFY